ncbi:alkaline phosphatase family protein [Terriglobus sp. ADX1]
MAIVACVFCTQIMSIEAQSKADHPKVVLISLDAFPAETLHDPNIAAPTLHALMKSGAYAQSMLPINPTVTWPNHTAMVTGQDASHHHVLVNGLIVDQRTNAAPKVDAQASKDQLVAVPTVYDIAHNAGLTTAEVDWVAIMHAPTIDWRFAEKPDPDGPIEKDLITQGVATREDLANFSKPRQAWRDRLYTAAAVDILRRHHPDLLMLHLLALDGIEHRTGFGTDADYNTIAFLDDRVKEVMDAVAANGDTARTTFVIVSDHGQSSVHKQLHPGALLAKAGLGSGSANPTFAMADGGFALVYQKAATHQSVLELKKLFNGQEGILSALTPEEASAMGWPTPSQTTQAPDLLLYAKNDYAFAHGKDDTFVTQTEQVGQHGYPNTEPLMQAIFIASGRGIVNKGQIPSIPNLDIGPTIARLLGLTMSNIQGKPLTDILN